MRLLHLIDATPGAGREPDALGSDASLLATRTLIERNREPDPSVLLGGSAARDRARGIGLDPSVVVCPPRGVPELARRALAGLDADADAVHCTSPASVALARSLFGDRVPVTACFMSPPARTGAAGSGPWSLSGRALAIAGTPIVCCHEPDRRAWRAFEPSPGAITLASPPTPRPELNRAGARERLGLDERDVALVLLADPPRAGDAHWFAALASLLSAAALPIVGIVPRGSASTAPARRYLRLGTRSARIIWSGWSGWSLLAASDLAVLCPSGPGATGGERLAVGTAHAAGIPVVCPRPGLVAALAPPAVRAHLAARVGQAPEMGRLLLPLVRDPALRLRIGRSLRRSAAARRSTDRFVRACERMWSDAIARRTPRSDRVGNLAGQI